MLFHYVYFQVMRKEFKKYDAQRSIFDKLVDLRKFDETPSWRGIEWSLRAFASMRAVRLFLRVRAVINFLMWAESTLEITNGERRALRKFSISWNLSLLKRCFAPSNLADTFKTGPCYLGRSVSINVNKTRKHFSGNIHGVMHMFSQCSQFPIGETLFAVSAFVFKMQIMRTLHGRDF